MIRRPPRSTPLYSSAASDVYKRQLRERGERLSLDLVRATEAGQHRELSDQLRRLEVAIAERRVSIRERNRTSDMATSIIEALRTASDDVVERDLKRVEPLLQRIYAAVDPHP